MVVGAISSRTELAVIGAGPGGYVAALRAADAGLDVTLIERDQLGGTCLNVGCIPSKSLIETANMRHHALTAGPRGLQAAVEVDGQRLARHLVSVSSHLRSGVQTLLDDAGVTVVTGNASFARYDRLSIETGDSVSHLEFDNAILATGSRPIELPQFPVGGHIVNSTGALGLTSVPATMAIIGGGYIGIELGTAWAKLGAAVTIIEATASILPDTPAALRQPVVRRLGELGVTVLTNQRAHQATPRGLQLDDGTDLAAEIVVVAVGRRPNSDQASIDTLQIELSDSGHIVVDNKMCAGQGIYAIGDLVGGPALAHKASAQAEVAVQAIQNQPTAFDPAALPAVIFSDPEIMTVGISLDQASAAGHAVHRFPHAASARARTIGDTSGATFIVADQDDTIVGVHAVGPHASELAGEAVLAIELAVTLQDLTLTIHPHPTMSESIAEAGWLARGMPLHIRR